MAIYSCDWDHMSFDRDGPLKVRVVLGHEWASCGQPHLDIRLSKGKPSGWARTILKTPWNHLDGTHHSSRFQSWAGG